jgi:7-keto-8-aminopelargonate synthetase-like enzyme
MTGHLAPYDQIHALAKKYNARTYVDDAHGLGVIGTGGRGTPSHFNLTADVMMGTFSKSLASQGGYICASADVIDWLRHKARTFMFSAALAPSATASALEALRVLKAEPKLVETLAQNAKHLKAGFSAAGLNTMGSETSVVPVFVGDDEAALYVCQQLLKMGVFTTPVVYPAVPRGNAVVRCSVMATHTKNDLDRAISAFTKLAPMILKAQGRKNDQEMSLADGLDGSAEDRAQLAAQVAQKTHALNLQ